MKSDWVRKNYCSRKTRRESGLSHCGSKGGGLWVGGPLRARRTPLHLFTVQPASNLKLRFQHKPQFLSPILNAKQGLWFPVSPLLEFRPLSTPPPKIIRVFVWIPACCGTQWAALRRKIDNLHGRVIWMKLHLTASLQTNKRREGASAKLQGLAPATAAGAAQGKKSTCFFNI